MTKRGNSGLGFQGGYRHFVNESRSPNDSMLEPKTLTLHVSPSPPSYFEPIAVIICLAFSGQNLIRCWSASPADAVINGPEDISDRRLERTIRVNAHRELSPDIAVVTAVLDREVVGVAVWNTPERLWRKETVAERAYRTFVSLSDQLDDWMRPPTWLKMDWKAKYFKLITDSKQRHLGSNYRRDTWYLDILAVHPKMQRKGIGTALLDWGLEQAGANGERVYLEATEVGLSLYLAKGFEEVGEVVMENGDLRLQCMVWPPRVGNGGANKQ